MVRYTTSTHEALLDALSHRILVVAGGLGTHCQAYHLEERDYRGEEFRHSQVPLHGNHDVLCLTCPDIVRTIHEDMFANGADIAETNTFNANRISQEEYGLQGVVYRINKAAAELARQAAERYTDRPRFVAGQMGPTKRVSSLAYSQESQVRDIAYEELVEAYAEQARGLVDGKADMLLVECIFDTLNAKAAVAGIMTVFADTGHCLPVLISGTVFDASARLLSGQTLHAFHCSLRHAQPLAIGLNCSMGAAGLAPHIAALADVSDCGLLCMPNAGMPNAFGAYEQDPESFVQEMLPIMQQGLVNVVGGCCGASHAHIKLLAEAAASLPPRRPSTRRNAPLSGLEPLYIIPSTSSSPCIPLAKVTFGEVICNGLQRARQLVRQGKRRALVLAVDRQVEYVTAEVWESIVRMLMADPDTCQVPVAVLSDNEETQDIVLRNSQGRSLVYLGSPKNRYARAIQLLRYGASVLVDACSSSSDIDPATHCAEALQQLQNIGFLAQDVVFDLTAMADWETRIGSISVQLPWCGFLLPPQQKCPHCMLQYPTGLDAAQANPGASIHSMSPDGTPCAARDLLMAAVINREDENLISLLGQALKHLTVLEIIQGPLMGGLAVVGQRYAEGTCFLSQVLASARLMRQAVNWLQQQCPMMKINDTSNDRPCIVVATVSGDVHSIGKRIVASVLECCFRVVDLGESVPPATLLQAVVKEKPVLVGLSGSITPSVKQIAHCAQALARHGCKCPLLVGGAATSAITIAINVAQHYPGLVNYVPNVCDAFLMASQLMDDRNRSNVLGKVTAYYNELRHRYQVEREQHLVPLETARSHSFTVSFAADNVAPRPHSHGDHLGIHVIGSSDVTLDDCAAVLNWDPFFMVWGLTGRAPFEKFPKLLDDPLTGEEARRVFQAAQSMLQRIIADRLLQVHGVVAFFPANSLGDDILLYDPKGSGAVIGTMHGLRQQQPSSSNGTFKCVADFVLPQGQGIDYVGLMAVSAGFGTAELAAKYRAEGDEFSALLLQSLAGRLTEAAAEVLHLKVRQKYWGYAPDDVLDRTTLLAQSYRGVRAAPGYPCLPDHSEMFTLWQLAQVEEHTGIQLTSGCMMSPSASTCSLLLAHKQAHYFSVGNVGRDQMEDYAERKGWTAEQVDYYLDATFEAQSCQC